jgi:hypothetical protein
LGLGGPPPAGAPSPQAEDEIRLHDSRNWPIDGFPWSLESQMNPWSLKNVSGWNILAALFDLLFVFALFVLLIESQIRWWPRIKVGMRGLLLLVAAFAGAAYLLAIQRNEQAAEEKCIAELSADIGFRRFQYASDVLSGAPPSSSGIKIEIEGWNPPTWLPESLLKIGNFAEAFRCVSSVELSESEAIDDAALARLRPFRELHRLDIRFAIEISSDGRSESKSISHAKITE